MKVGQTIDGQWIISETMGRGGQGEVFKVTDSIDSCFYALKFLNKQSDEERRQRMFMEVCNVKHLSDRHLMNITYSNAEKYKDLSEKLYYVSDFIDGISLEQYVETHDISYAEAISFYMEFLKTIECCHNNGIIHRDIKPDNIMLKQGNLDDFVLIDFGLSFNLEDDDGCTPTNQQLGNRFLILPELVSGTSQQKRSLESDLSQSAAILLYVLTGEIPNALFDGEGKPPHKRDNAKRIISEKVENNTVLKSLNYFFDKAFSNNLSERYHSAGDMRREMATLNESRFNILGGGEMNDIIAIDGNRGLEKYRYSELIRHLNPSTELCNPEGLKLPIMTDIPQLVEYGIALPPQLQSKVKNYYLGGDFVTAANTVWIRSMGLLRKRVLSLGEDFVADMVEASDIDYVRNLPAYRLIDLAHELGFINKAGQSKLQKANEFYNYFNNDEADEYEEMPQDEANIIIKTCISYILYNNHESFGLQFNDFREKLKSGRVTELFDDDRAMFATCPYFYLKTSVRSLLNLFRDCEGIEYDNVVINMQIMFPAIWERLKIEERRALADAYTDYINASEHKKINDLNKIMLQVHAFDYVKENVRSRTYIQVANKLLDVHFDVNNFYNEPGIIKKLEDLGSQIPTLALKETITSVLYVKLGNSYGTSWSAETIADRILERLTESEWITYLESYMLEETNLIDSINDCNKMRNQWKSVIKKYNLKELTICNPQIKRLVSIA